MTTGVGIREATLSPDGTRLAYSKGGLVANVWRVPILDDRAATWADAEQITFDEAYIEHFDLSRDGRRLVISSDHTGRADIWVLPVDGGDIVARASRRHPVLLTMLGDGRMHLSGIAELARHLTESNRDELLTRATHKTKDAIKELVAEIAPKPDVPPVIRKLPKRPATPADAKASARPRRSSKSEGGTPATQQRT